MRSQHVTAKSVVRPESAAPDLSGHLLAVARAAWALLVSLNLILFVIAVPALFIQRSAPPEEPARRLRSSAPHAIEEAGIRCVELAQREREHLREDRPRARDA